MTTEAWEDRLADGRAIVLRRAGSGDVPAIARLYSELSPASFERRFHSGQSASELVARLSALNAGTSSLVAALQLDPDHLVGEARYVPTGAGTAECGLAVLDGCQGLGLGSTLLAGLALQARRDGLDRLRLVVLLSNPPMLCLLRRYGWVLAAPTDEFCEACLEISTDGEMPGWPADQAGRRVLVERRGWFDDERTAVLRAAGLEVRQCAGPFWDAGRRCPLVTSGTCRLAEEADVIVSRLPPSDPDSGAIHAVHQHKWAYKLV